ncbi:hypothetical protein TRFO_37571 [Tritrichomonas foetus]|uniref:Tetraspanin family protein n=1 Tax=Tritrichomonas foetus TaxID=1144522 RepID=A0A1J4JAU1_9EUKA|nr:hypothetical protein TRFO_37571 [Tritrichomonas foetus]|eukprot:OHS96272.1 hypothetical protein TRFO_37571 [Tritrichomonas foetus]
MKYNLIKVNRNIQMSLGTYLATKLQALFVSFKTFFILVFLSYLLTGIFNSVLASLLNNDVFLLLYHGKKLRDFSISLLSLCFGFFFIFGYLGYSLYFNGARKVIQLTLFLMTIGSMIGTIVLLIFSIKYSSTKEENLIVASFIEILNGGVIPDAIKKWAEKRGCTTVDGGCNDEARQYVHLLANVGFFANIILVLITCLSLIGLITVIVLMGAIRPVDRNFDSETSDENEDTLTKSAVLEQPTDYVQEKMP